MSKTDPAAAAPKPKVGPEWKTIVAKYQGGETLHSIWQVANTLIPYAVLWVVMIYAIEISYWLMLPVAIVAAGLLVRIFIIFHDCGHGSFFASRKANDTIGFITGIITWTPYFYWRWQHAMHHGSSGDLDRRGTGDVWTMTVAEYLAAPRWKRLCYRLARNPILLFVIGPLLLFTVWQRIPPRTGSLREKMSVHWTTLCIILVAWGMSLLIGWKDYLLIQLTVIMIGGSAGVWLFYVQHQFEGVTWDKGHEWDFATAALHGSSFYRLPKILQWFTGSIGFHHIHHLSPRIPNYKLEKAHAEEPLFQTVVPVTLLTSLKSLTFRLWDEQQQKLVSFAQIRHLPRQPRPTA